MIWRKWRKEGLLQANVVNDGEDVCVALRRRKRANEVNVNV
jgi:hypothetical protein